MHVAEIQQKINRSIPLPLRKNFLISFMVKTVNKVLDVSDNIRYQLFFNKKTSNSIETETNRLLWSWVTFSKKYLKHSHGQDVKHPSRAVAVKMIQSIISNQSKKTSQLKLLEIPVGMGTDAEHFFSKMNLDYTGMELNPKQIKINRKRLPGIRFIQGNILDLDVPDDGYDVVYCRHIFEHLSLETAEIALKEVVRVAKKHVILVFFRMSDVPNHVNTPVRQYHYNLLSKKKIEQYLTKLSKVKCVHTTHVPHKLNATGDWIFDVEIKQ